MSEGELDDIRQVLDRLTARQDQILACLVGGPDMPGLIEAVREQGDQIRLVNSQLGDLVDAMRVRGLFG